jgi:hypothetical protein
MLARLPKSLRWLLGIVLGLFVLLAVTVLIGERLIDTPRIRAQLSEKLSRVLNGHVSWETLDFRLLPRPHAEVRGVHVALPNLLTLDVGLAHVTIRLLPLFRGNAEVQDITLQRPNVDVWISPAKAESGEQSSQPTAPIVLYRNALRPLLDAVGRFAPAAIVAVQDGRVALHFSGLPPLEARELQAQIITDGGGCALSASAAGSYWGRIAIDGRVESADLRALLKVKASQLKLQQALEDTFSNMRQSLVLSDADAELEAATDGHTDIRVALGLDLPKADVTHLAKRLAMGPVRIAGSVKFIENNIAVALDEIRLGELVKAATANLQLTGAEHLPELDITAAELDLARLRDALMTLLASQPSVTEYIARIHAGRARALRLSTRADSFARLFALSNLRGSVQLVDASMSVPTLERDATNIMANAELASGVVKVGQFSARLGASQLQDAGWDIVLLKPMGTEHGRGRATIVLQDLLRGMRARAPFAKLLRPVPSLSGVADVAVRTLALRFDKPSRIAYDLSVSPRHIRVDSDKLPGALGVHGGAVRVTPRLISADRVGIEVLDSRATVSGELTDFQGGKPQATARVADGVIAPKLIDWIWLRAQLNERLKPTRRLNFAAQRVRWSKAGLDVEADATVDSGPSFGIELSKRANNFTLRRVLIKDRDSDANVSFAMHDSSIEVGFAGVLAARSFASVLGRPAERYPGSISGTIQGTLDRTRRGRSEARGDLAGEHVDLLSLTGTPLKLERFKMQGEGQALQIRELALDWAEQKAEIRGMLAREANGIAATLEIDSPGIVIDAFQGTPTAKSASAPVDKESHPRKSFNPWSLPVTGTVSLRSAFVEARGHRVQGLRAVATLQHETLKVNVTEASLCGISFPLSLRMTPKELDAKVNVTAKNQSLEGGVQCLTGVPVIMTGNFDIAGTLTAQGTPDEISEAWAKHIAGTVAFSARDGVIRKGALLGNILSLKSVRDLLKGDVGLGEHGFKYRSISVGATIANGQVSVEHATLDSPALGMAAAGTVNLENYDSRLTVLVAPFSNLDRMVRKTPVLGYVIGGTLTSIPVGVTGDIRNPLVVPLGPRAVGSQVLGVFERTFKLPGKIVEPLSAKPGT